MWEQLVRNLQHIMVVHGEVLAMPKITQLLVNGVARRVQADPERSLLSVLRDDLDLTGSKYGCGEGECGACTVLIDGEATPSCQTPVKEAAGKQIVTIEGLTRDGSLHPLQQAFLEVEAMQCGYCTPGMIVAGAGLLLKNPNPSEAEILQHMERNLCRCGTYGRIVQAIRRAAAIMKESGSTGTTPAKAKVQSSRQQAAGAAGGAP